MGRPSKLTDAQWETIAKRRLGGESYDSIAKDYPVSKASIIAKVKDRISTVKTVANQLVTAESALRSLPVSDQILTVNVADDLRATAANIASVSATQSATARRLAALANIEASKISDADPLSDPNRLKGVAALAETANRLSEVPLRLIAATAKTGGLSALDEPPAADQKRIAEMTAEEAQRAYDDLMG